jgi:sigma-E factor negative regulatory protein RseB
MVRLFLAFLLVFKNITALAGGLIETEEPKNTSAEPIDAWAVLEKSAYAARVLNYEGQFIYVNGQNTRTVDIKHMNYGGKEVARNIVLDANQREVYSEGENIVILQPTTTNVVIEKRHGKNLFPAMLPTNLALIKENYSAKIVGTDFIAEREANIIELMPSDGYRYRYKVWSDAKFGLMLKMALVNEKNKTLEQIYFNKISMLNSQNNPNWFQPKIDMSKSYVTEAEPVITRVANDQIVTTDLPSGYQKVDHIQRIVNSEGVKVDQLIFSDGIASVSLFIEPVVKGKRPKKGHMLMGSTNVCANVVDGHQIIVVGEVPEKTVKSIAKAVSFKTN